jgi:hypothetical protein
MPAADTCCRYLLGTSIKVEYPADHGGIPSDDGASAIDQGAIMTLGKAGLVAAATALSMWCATSDASALGYDDIIGNWCSATARLEFSHETMGVFLFSDKSHLSRKITKYEFDGSTVTVRWYLENELTSSTFGEFSPDGRTMFLQPGTDVPRREYHRC